MQRTPHTPPFQVFNAIKLAAGALLALAAVAAFSSSGHAAVFGTDERRPLDAHTAPLAEKIGTLTAMSTGALCTAFCVAPDAIATASHCVFGTSVSAGPRLRDLDFKLGAGTSSERASGLDGARSVSQDQSIISGTQQLAVAPPIGAAQDWAVAKLDTPICSSGGLAIATPAQPAIAVEGARGEIYQVAIHADLPGAQLRLGGPCAVYNEFPTVPRAALARDFKSLDAIVFHTCDTGGGSSGSPLLVDGPSGPEVIAMNVGTYVLARSAPAALKAATNTNKSAVQSEAVANTGITLADMRAAIEELTDGGDTLTNSVDILRIKSMLLDAGFFHGAMTRDVTPEMRDAVRRFNTASGHTSSARLTPELDDDLRTWLRKRQSDAPPRLMPHVPAHFIDALRNN